MEEHRLYESPQEGFSLCVWVRERLPDLQEGYLDAMTAETIRAHLSVCYLCAKEYNEMEITVRLIETLPYVEPVKDHAPAIMAAIRSQPEYSFQTPVVEVETQTLERLLSPRTTTGQTSRRNGRRADMETRGWGDAVIAVSPRPRVPVSPRHPITASGSREPGAYVSPAERWATALVLIAAILGLILTPWGRIASGAVGAWSGQALQALTAVPVLGGLLAMALGALDGAVEGAAGLLSSIRSVPLSVVFTESALFAAGLYAWAMLRGPKHARAFRT